MTPGQPFLVSPDRARSTGVLYLGRHNRGALKMVSSYPRSAALRQARYENREVRDYLRRQQRLRYLPARVREPRNASRLRCLSRAGAV